ncbi:MAG: HNH endonuclease [Pirellulaceae bacterium]|nr:HNH endonuclease [Pirellulaceae bacterium]
MQSKRETPVQESTGPSVLNSSVLVLNRFYLAVHVVSMRRAFGLLYTNHAEVVHLEDGHFANYDFEAWCELSQIWTEFSELSFSEGESALGIEEEWVRSVNFVVRAPRVIRLYQYDRMPKQTLRFSRRNLFARDEHRCQYCGQTKPTSQLSVDHVIPRSRGGETTWENVVCSCVDCNGRKGGRTPKEARMKLLRAPKRPRHNPLLAAKMRNPKYQSWSSFLPTDAPVNERVRD